MTSVYHRKTFRNMLSECTKLAQKINNEDISEQEESTIQTGQQPSIGETTESQLEVELSEYADSIAKVRNEASAEIASWQTKAAEMIETFRAQTGEEISWLKDQIQEKVQGYEAALTEYAKKEETNRSSIEKFEQLIGSLNQEVAQLRDKLSIVAEDKRLTELECVHKQQVLSENQHQVKALAEQMVQLKEQLNNQMRAGEIAQSQLAEQKHLVLQANEQVSLLTQQVAHIENEASQTIDQLKSQLQEKSSEYANSIEKIKNETSLLVNKNKAETEKTISVRQSQFDENVQQYQVLLEKADLQLLSERKLNLEYQQQLRHLCEKLKCLHERLIPYLEQLNVQTQRRKESELKQWMCECCNTIQSAGSKAFRIDSGQILCTRCVQELREFIKVSDTGLIRNI